MVRQTADELHAPHRTERAESIAACSLKLWWTLMKKFQGAVGKRGGVQAYEHRQQPLWRRLRLQAYCGYSDQYLNMK